LLFTDRQLAHHRRRHFLESLEKFFPLTISRRASASTGKFWLTFDDEILAMMTLVSRLARLHHHFFLDFIFQ